MRAIFCVIFALYLFNIGKGIKVPKYGYEKIKFHAITGTIYFVSFVFAFVGVVLVVFGL